MIDYRHPVREAKKDAPKSKSLKKGETVSLTALARGCQVKITAHERSRITGLGRHWVLVTEARHIVADVYGKGGQFRLVPRVSGPLSAKVESYGTLADAVRRAEGKAN